MLCPEVWNFPPPKVVTSYKKTDNLDSVLNFVNMNKFYRSVVITCPDEIRTPESIEHLVTVDSDYYHISSCPLVEFLKPTFIENFVKNGSLYCLTTGKNSIVENCACITPDGILTVHVLEFIYQTLGLEGKKRPHNYYEIQIDLKNIRNPKIVIQKLSKLGTFDFNIIWEPEGDICPSSIAKYLYDRGVRITQKSLEIKKLNPDVTEIPSPKDVEADEMVEWVGLLAIEADIYSEEPFINNYVQPESDLALKSTRISFLIAKGFLTSSFLLSIGRRIAEYVKSRELENYWASISIQSQQDSLWQWKVSSPNMFQAQNTSTTIFFTHDDHILYSIGELKYE